MAHTFRASRDFELQEAASAVRAGCYHRLALGAEVLGARLMMRAPSGDPVHTAPESAAGRPLARQIHKLQAAGIAAYASSYIAEGIAEDLWEPAGL